MISTSRTDRGRPVRAFALVRADRTIWLDSDPMDARAADTTQAPGSRTLTLACAECGYSRRGITDPGAPCPECGAPVAWPDASGPWLITFDSALRLLCWSIPGALLAWASPMMFEVAHAQDTMPFVSNASWPVLIAVSVIAFALRQITRCQAPAPASVWCARLSLAAVGVMACDVAGAGRIVQRLASLALPNSYNFVHAIWPTLVMVVLAAAALTASIVLATAVRSCGLFRAALRVWRTAAVAAMGATALQIWAREGSRFAPDGGIQSGTSKEPPLQKAIFLSIDIAQFLAPLLIVILTLVAWHAVALARGQLASRPGLPARPGA